MWLLAQFYKLNKIGKTTYNPYKTVFNHGLYYDQGHKKHKKIHQFFKQFS